MYFCSDFCDFFFFLLLTSGFVVLSLVALGVWLGCLQSFLFLEVGLSCYKLPLRTAFATSLRFWIVFSLSFVFIYFKISSLISSVNSWLFRRVLFSLHVFMIFTVFFPPVISNLIVLWFERCLISIFIIFTET